MQNVAMLKPLHRLRQKIVHAIRTEATDIHDFEFKFHLEPYEIEIENDKNYCSFDDFS